MNLKCTCRGNAWLLRLSAILENQSCSYRLLLAMPVKLRKIVRRQQEVVDGPPLSRVGLRARRKRKD